MARDSLHNEPFDEATKAKLELFQLYSREWLPVFTSPPNPWKSEINIFDFFAGPGKDCEGTPGSPLRILKEVTSPNRLEELRSKNLQVRVWFSDKSGAKVSELRNTVAALALDPSFDSDAMCNGSF